MWRHPILAALLLAPAQAFEPAPIRWGGSESKRFVIAPSRGKSWSKPAKPPQTLTIIDSGKMSPDIPHFSAKPDSTIAWDANGWCLEASGARSGNEVLLNRCNSGKSQQWNWLPWGPIQLKGTNQCVDASRQDPGNSDGSLLALHECEDKMMGTWRFEDPDASETQQPELSFSMRNVIVSLVSLLALVVLSLSDWVWLWRYNVHALPINHSSSLPDADEDGVSLAGLSTSLKGSVPLSVRDVPAVMTVSADARDELITTCRFNPGKLGITGKLISGRVTGVQEGSQAEREGVQQGMRMMKIDHWPYSRLLLDARIAGTENYEITFARDPSGAFQKFRAWCGKYASKDKLAVLGADAFFTYGFMSNVNVGFIVGMAWYAFTRSSGLSPLAPGQWGKFGATYAGIYLSLGTILRPFRIALSVALTPYFSKAFNAIQNRLPFCAKRPRVARTAAMVLFCGVGNVGGLAITTVLGVWLSSLLTGVAPFPPGWRGFAS